MILTLQILVSAFILGTASLFWKAVRETPLERSARRKREHLEASKAHLRRVVRRHVEREQRKALERVREQGEEVLSQVTAEYESQAFNLDNRHSTQSSLAMKEIILPPHLYDRIKASAGEHGGIGKGELFEGIGEYWRDCSGIPVCVHGHAWGTKSRYFNSKFVGKVNEPELAQYLSFIENDRALEDVVGWRGRIPFEEWCKLLNVKRGVEAPPEIPAVQRRECVPA